MAKACAIPALLSFLLYITFVVAHSRLDTPEPRSDDDNLKVGPCGDLPYNPDESTTVEPGPFTFEWNETISHPGWFRLAMSIDPDDDYDSYVLADCLFVHERGGIKSYQYEVEIPDINCERCSFQLIQVMTDNTQRPFYFSCANVQITGTTSLDEFTFENQARSSCSTQEQTDASADEQTQISTESSTELESESESESQSQSNSDSESSSSARGSRSRSDSPSSPEDSRSSGDSSSSSSSGDSSNHTVIIVVSCIVGALVIVALIGFIVYRKKKQRRLSYMQVPVEDTGAYTPPDLNVANDPYAPPPGQQP